ncbi:methionyl-tRNA formyltransferase [Pseudoteredinibacter isoporae]|uniref:Methionyl-tRNA formyltransferase n=1 Tax=Pseudoteredinibacter isoporae TaxID=570281 RepID=A0A7X0JRP6_9GAMM|nr:methionyl-tRNA formyltransferase [Pseudoteredinibacter isoporae]MBB6520165.1 methionyl-tRNA formyltransferase [Pseudoteredinibacter isoporae]NHO85737.1 methionyl-tRNA formyltransferase [Pseudoteredinibacter isoporae]NIB25811.1 methionyl-tRNA formyltransferase [Pseudoteredinibacter isoporae]
MPLNIVFAGTPDFAAAHLNTLLESEHNVVAVYTQPDRPANRGKSLQASPVKQVALKHDIAVYQPLNFKDANDRDDLAALNADIMVVVAYGLLLPQSVLDTPKYGCINVHASLLPRWRGAAPIQRAVEAGDAESGVCIMQMDAGLDTGPVLVSRRFPLTPDETGGSLHDKLLETGGPALLEALEQIAAGRSQPEIQAEEGVTYAHKFNKADAAIDWQRPAVEVERKVRAYNPFPVAHCGFEDKGKEQRLRIWQARAENSETSLSPGEISKVSNEGLWVACGDGRLLHIESLQLPGKKAMTLKDLLNGRSDLFVAGGQLN